MVSSLVPASVREPVICALKVNPEGSPSTVTLFVDWEAAAVLTCFFDEASEVLPCLEEAFEFLACFAAESEVLNCLDEV